MIKIKEYLKAGYPALCILSQEPHRAENLLSNDCGEGWDCHGNAALVNTRSIAMTGSETKRRFL